jgi:prevent-host-death family protein
MERMQSWPIHEAKARLSELVKRAQQQPQQLTSHGEPVADVLSAEDYHRHRHEGESLVAFIRRSPLVGVDDLNLERSSDFTRDMEL